jgi:hypothetical protein
MEVSDFIELLRYSEFEQKDYGQIINFCNIKINETIKNKVNLFVKKELNNPRYPYLDFIEKTDFLNFIKRMTFISLKLYKSNDDIYQIILFEYQRNKYNIIKKIDIYNEIEFIFNNNNKTFAENIKEFIIKNKFNFSKELLIGFFIDLFNQI